MDFGVKIPCVRLTVAQLREAGRLIFCGPALRLPTRDAHRIADYLSKADVCGYPSHGLQRALRYILAVLDGHLDPLRPPTVAHRFKGNCRIEAAHTLGRLAMQSVVGMAYRLGSKYGSAFVSTYSHHIGRMAPYLEWLAVRGFIVHCQVNAVGAPTTSMLTKRPKLGTNPLGLAVPGPDGIPFSLDFTPAGTTEGNMRVLHASGMKVPLGLLLDENGESTDDPGVLYRPTLDKLGAILPFGGPRMHTMAHLMSMIEMGPGALTGNISAALDGPRPVRGFNAVLLSVVHPELAFGIPMAEYIGRVAQTVKFIKESPPMDPRFMDDDGTVLLPGQYERKMRRHSEANGVLFSEATWNELHTAATKVGASIDHIVPIERMMA